MLKYVLGVLCPYRMRLVPLDIFVGSVFLFPIPPYSIYLRIQYSMMHKRAALHKQGLRHVTRLPASHHRKRRMEITA